MPTSPVHITASSLQNYARRLSNSSWCRHWLHWNYPCRSPVEMAINCHDENGRERVPDFDRIGIPTEVKGNHIYYLFTRVNDDGSLYESTL